MHVVREAAENALTEILSLETSIEDELSREQDKHQEAELLSYRTLAIREGQSEPVHADTATDLNNLALFIVHWASIGRPNHSTNVLSK